MSIIPKLGTNFCNLPDVLDRYVLEIESAGERLALKGKSIEQANRDQVEWSYHYDQQKSELETLSKYMLMRVDRTRGEQYRKYTENYSRELADRAKDKYIDHDPEYLSIYELYLEVFEVLDKIKSVVDAFKTRGYALRQINEARVHQFNQSII